MKLPSGLGGVVKNGGNRRRPYQARITIGYDDNGKQLYDTIGWFEKREDAITALIDNKRNPKDFSKLAITFKDLYEKWNAIHFPTIGDSAVNGYKTAYNYCKELYEIPFIEITFGMLQDVIDNSGKDYSIKYLIRSLFNMMYRFAKRKELVKEKLSKDLDIGKKVTKHRKIPFTDEEIQTLFDNVDKIENADTVLILIFSCMRINEMLKKIDNINFDERYMINGSKTESGKDRVIPISLKILDFIKKRYNTETKYLIEIDGKPVSYRQYINEIWNPIMEQLNMNHTPHECRHTRKFIISKCWCRTVDT